MKWVIALFFVAGVCCFSGCGFNGKQAKSVKSFSQSDRFSESDLQQSLDNFEEFFSNAVIDVSDELDRLSPVTRPNRSTLKLRSVTIKASGAMLGQDDPLNAFIDMWVLSARLSQYFESGLGRNSFKPNQQIVIDAFRKVELQIENIGIEYLDKKHYEDARRKVYDFSKANPIQQGLKETVLFATETYEGQPSPFEDMVFFPLIPLTMVNGVTEGVTGSGKMSESLGDFADVLEEFPESARWQLLMLLYDIEKLDSVKSGLASMSEFSNSTSALADSAQTLPKELRQEISALLTEVEEKSQNIRKLMESADKTSSSVKQAIETANDLTRSVNVTLDKLQLALAAWTGAADSTGVVISKVMELQDAANSPDAAGLDIKIYAETARQFADIADKLPAVLSSTDTLTKKLTRRIASLIILLFALILAYKLITKKRLAR